jgi:hypothetical protein
MISSVRLAMSVASLRRAITVFLLGSLLLIMPAQQHTGPGRHG